MICSVVPGESEDGVWNAVMVKQRRYVRKMQMNLSISYEVVKHVASIYTTSITKDSCWQLKHEIIFHLSPLHD